MAFVGLTALALTIFFIATNGRWIKFHIEPAMLILPLLLPQGIFWASNVYPANARVQALYAKIRLVKWRHIRSPQVLSALLFIGLTIEMALGFGNVWYKSEEYAPRREMADWLREHVTPDKAIIISHGEHYIRYYSHAKYYNYSYPRSFAMEQGFLSAVDPWNWSVLEHVFEELAVQYVVGSPSVSSAEPSDYEAILELCRTSSCSIAYETRRDNISLVAYLAIGNDSLFQRV